LGPTEYEQGLYSFKWDVKMIMNNKSIRRDRSLTVWRYSPGFLLDLEENMSKFNSRNIIPYIFHNTESEVV
jgi:hypothetical protein